MKLKSIKREFNDAVKAWEGYGVGSLAAHLHHEVAFEFVTEPICNRLKYIRDYKDNAALRLRCCRPVPLSKIPKFLREARAKRDEVWAKRDETWAKYDTARATFGEAWAKLAELWEKYDKVLVKLGAARVKYHRARAKLDHDSLCPLGQKCPWDGYTIVQLRIANGSLE